MITLKHEIALTPKDSALYDTLLRKYKKVESDYQYARRVHENPEIFEKIKVRVPGKNTFYCAECSTYYHITGENPPPSPKWDDGHICKMEKLT
jgi:hypothetical protein